jgi:hypothetical protein
MSNELFAAAGQPTDVHPSGAAAADRPTATTAGAVNASTVPDTVPAELTERIPSQSQPCTFGAEAGTDLASRMYLDQVMAMVGVDGLVAALRTPALLAAVDQHAAAVRTSLHAAGKRIDADSLAAYARSVFAVAQRCNWSLPEHDAIDWRRPEWTVLRLVSVCSLAEAADCF